MRRFNIIKFTVWAFLFFGFWAGVRSPAFQGSGPTFAGEWNVTIEDYTYGSLAVGKSYWVISLSGSDVSVYDMRSQFSAVGTASGNTLTAKWIYDPLPENKFVLTLSADGNSFEGNYEGWFAVGGKTWGNYRGKRAGGVEIKEPDKDGDGVPDCMDLCPAAAGNAKSFGCPKDQRIGNMVNFVSAKLKEQIADFLSCAKIPELPAIPADEWDIELDLKPGAAPEFVEADNMIGMVLRGKNARGIPVIRADLPAFIHFVKKELSLKCGTASPAGAKSHGDFYHEIGHLLADRLNLVRIDPYGEHDKWLPFANAGSAFDEARADLFMVLMSRHLKRPIRDSFGVEKARSNIPGRFRNQGHLIAEADTSLLLDALPQDPCAAAKMFVEANHHSLARGLYQDIDGWLIGCFDAARSLPLDERIEMERRMARGVKAYGIETSVGFIEDIDDPAFVEDMQIQEESSFLNPLDRRLVKRIDLSSEPGRIKVHGPNTKIRARTLMGWYQVLSIETEFETVVAENNEITTVVLEGSVEIAPPGQKPFVLEKGRTFTWSGE